MRNRDSVTGLLISAIQPFLKYMVPREGQVKDLVDPEKKGRILVQIPSLGWDTNDKGAWCKPIDKNSLSTVKVDDWVIIQFVDGNRDFPIYIGKSTRIKDQLPKSYDGKDTTHTIFESPNDKIVIKYDEKKDLLQIGKKDFKGSARIDDTTISSNSEDSAFWTWLSGFINVFIAWVPVPQDGGAALKTALSAYLTPNPTPTKMDGKINSGSSQVEVGDK